MLPEDEVNVSGRSSTRVLVFVVKRQCMMTYIASHRFALKRR